jgi:hypothetical protein
MSENVVNRSKREVFERPLIGLSEELQDLSSVVTPAQIHHYVKTFEQYARTVIGARCELGIEIAEDLGPVPSDYLALVLDILIECSRLLGSTVEAVQFVKLRLSEVRKHPQFSYIVIEIKYCDPSGDTGQGLSQELSGVRGQIEEYCGAFFIDAAFGEQVTIRVLLPIVSWVY